MRATFIAPPRTRIILASGSPRRRELVRMMGLEFELAVPEIDERFFPSVQPSRLVVRLALMKALSLKEHYPDALIIGADTIVVLDGRILGKPECEDHARRMLRTLSNRTHTVYTGLALVDAETGLTVTGYERSRVTMKRMSHAEIERYVETGEPMDKAGSYGIQGLGAVFIRHINGCFFNVMGLPVARLYDMFNTMSQKLEQETPFTRRKQ